jgi:hypothetical protein
MYLVTEPTVARKHRYLNPSESEPDLLLSVRPGASVETVD